MKKILFKSVLKSFALIAMLMLSQAIIAAPPAPTIINNIDGTWKLEPDGKNGMRVTFTPNPATVTCPDIRLIQTVKRTFYDAAGNATVATVANGLTPEGFKFKEPGMVPSGVGVDHEFCEKDPFYNGSDSGKDAPSKGVGPTGTPTSMWDAPNYLNSTFPAGKVKVKLEFEVCAICTSGPFTGVSYGCIKWEFIQEKGKEGISSVVGVPPAITPRTQDHIDATAKFQQTHTDSNGNVICPEELALKAGAEKIYEFLGLSTTTNSRRRLIGVSQDYEVVFATDGVHKGPAIPGGPLPIAPLGNGVSPGDFVFVPSGEDLCLRRSSSFPLPDPSIPFPASFTDLYFGAQETVETGILNGLDHSGIRVKNCSGITLCAVAPSSSTNVFGQVLYSVEINNQTQQVIIKNDLSSTHPILLKNVLQNLPQQTCAPGNSVIYNFPGQLPACVSTLRLKLFIEGYHSGTGMVAALANQSVVSNLGVCDSVAVDLHSAIPPFPIVASTKTLLYQNGDVQCEFPTYNGPFFVAVRHRSAIETWSGNPLNFNQGLAYHDFTNASSKAFGANQVQVAPGIWGFYNGDVNQDQTIDLLDSPSLEDDINNFEFGYHNTDLNADGSVDLLDLAILEQNINNFIFSMIPN